MKRPIFLELKKRLEEPRKFIQVLLGPRQVGKTTLAQQLTEEIDKPYHFVSADFVSLQGLSWLEAQWEIGRQKVTKEKGALLIIDEIQKIPNWSEMVKALWDHDTKNKINLSVMILGSSPWLMQKGLTESLTGRFEIIPMTHWSFLEMQKTFNWTVDQYIYFGGYPGAASLIEDVTRWKNYINDSLIETTISRDILLMTQINKPVLLRRLFQLGCQYSGQIISYSKMIGELDEVGNTTTVAHYLNLLSGAGLICGLQKYAKQPIRQKSSIPKLLVYNTALMTAQSDKSYVDAKEDRIFWGRLVESAIGAHILNEGRKNNLKCFYWREADKEVDFVVQHGKDLIAIEVKSGLASQNFSNVDLFIKNFHPKRVLLIGPQGMQIEEFLTTPLTKLLH
jgi:predicted AAA+ superfamily ATPase